MHLRMRLGAAIMTVLLLGWLGPLDVHAGTLDEIKARTKLIVGISAVTEPFEFKKEGTIVGYDVDIVELFAKDLGVSLELVDVAYAGILGGLSSRRFDMIQSGVTMSRERMQRVSFSIPYGEASRIIVVKKGTTDIAKPEDLANKVVGVELSSTTERYLRSLEGELKAKGLGGLKEIKTYEQLSDGYLNLEIGRDQAILDMKFRAYSMFRIKPGMFQEVCPIGPRQFHGAVFRKDDEEFLKVYNAFMTRIRKDGTLDRLQQKWLGYTLELPWEPVVSD